VVLRDLRVAAGERHPHQRHGRTRQLARAGLDGRQAQALELAVDRGDLAAAHDQREASPGALEPGGREGRAARVAVDVVGGVRVVAVVHLRHEAEVGDLAVLVEQAVEADQEVVAPAAGDVAR